MRVFGHAVHGEWCGSRVFPLDCKYCGERIYLFTCNCGCRVLFNELGRPWPLHLCAQYLIESEGYTRQQVDSMVKRRAIEMNIEAPEIDQLFSNRVKKKKTWDDPIKKDIPDSKEKQDVVGMIREIVEHIDPFKKLCVQKVVCSKRYYCGKSAWKNITSKSHASYNTCRGYRGITN